MPEVNQQAPLATPTSLDREGERAVVRPEPRVPNPVPETSETNAIRLEAQAQRSSSFLTTHKVKPGETLGLLAKKYYGDSSYSDKILEANGNPDPRKIKVGTVLNIPRLSDDNQIPNYPLPEHPQPSKGKYIVQAGDNLGLISLHTLNDASKWRLIAKANGLAEKDRLKVGQILEIPNLSDTKPISGHPLPNPKADFKFEKVRSGDTLRKIARRVYNDPELSSILQEDNSGIDNTNLKIGQNLRVRQGKVSLENAQAADNSEPEAQSDPRVTQTIGERVVALLDPESKKALRAKLKTYTGYTEQYALVEMATAAKIDLTPEGVRSFQEAQGLKQTGAINNSTAEAMAREMTAKWYKDLVSSQNPAYKWDNTPGKVNAIGLRGFDLYSGRNRNEILKWNDTIAFVSTTKEGKNLVWEFVATTEPGLARSKKYDSRTDANGDGSVDIATLIPGQYDYYPGEHKAEEHKGAKRYALVPGKPLPVYRDTNHDFKINEAEAQSSLNRGDVGYGINIHWGGHTPTTAKMSAGCQVLQLTYGEFLNKVSPLWNAQNHVFYTLIDMNAGRSSATRERRRAA